MASAEQPPEGRAALQLDIIEALDCLDDALADLRQHWSDPAKCAELVGLARNALQIVLSNAELLSTNYGFDIYPLKR